MSKQPSFTCAQCPNLFVCCDIGRCVNDTKPDATNPPATELWGKFAAEKWDHEYARNVLLHFLQRKGLDKECLVWLDKHFPDDKE